MSDSGSMVSLVTLWLDLVSGARALAVSEVEIATMPTNATAANEATNSRNMRSEVVVASLLSVSVPRSHEWARTVGTGWRPGCPYLWFGGWGG